jgi:hypothetical protein
MQNRGVAFITYVSFVLSCTQREGTYVMIVAQSSKKKNVIDGCVCVKKKLYLNKLIVLTYYLDYLPPFFVLKKKSGIPTRIQEMSKRQQTFKKSVKLTRR